MKCQDMLRDMVRAFGWRDVLTMLAAVARTEGGDEPEQALANVLDHMARYPGHTIVRHVPAPAPSYEVELHEPCELNKLRVDNKYLRETAEHWEAVARAKEPSTVRSKP